MVNVLSLITNDDVVLYVVDGDPSIGGLSASLGSEAVWSDGTTAKKYLKTGNTDTGWDAMSTSTGSGTVNSGVAGRVAVYPASSNTVDDIYVQNSQNIDVAVVAQPTRSAAIEYVIPNPGDAVTSADFVLTEGAQTINGTKTFGNDVVVSGNLTVNGSLTSLNTTNTTITDKIVTLNKGGLTGSAGGAGLEFEENAAITGYLKVSSARTGFELLAPGVSFKETLRFSNLSADRILDVPDASGAIVIQSATPAGVAGQLSFWSNSTTITNPTGTSTDSLFWDAINARLGIGNAAPSVALHVTGSARITSLNSAAFVKSDANGNLTNSAVSLTADVSGILPLTNGGSNASLTAVAGAIVYSSSTAMAFSAAGTAGQALLSGGSSSPTWFTSTGVVKASSGVLSTSAVDLTSEITGVLPVANGGTNSSTALNNNRIMVSSAGAIVEAAALTDGQLLIGSTGAAPVAAAITGTTNQVAVTNAAGSITLSTPQDIHSGATPTFAGETLSGAGAFFELIDAADLKMTTATVNTTNATQTTIATIATVTNSVMVIEAKITGLRTGGTAGTAGDSACYIRTAHIKNVGGTVSIPKLQADYTSEDQQGFNATITVSGTNVLVQVVGATNNNLTWKAVITKII
jgi:hypothetical protein